ncbi:hypothetical protein P3T18_003927 [Paraburkholderia sp. GAS199]|uniref:hypothetical protein n=1 Tax=Paraburkholderia sp. GAS199 TaxID=3035126 RepID=UPI003D2135E4
MFVGMSEYPCTGIDKAILKFALQDSKISQIVSVRISEFFLTFIRQFLPDSAFEHSFSALDALDASRFFAFAYDAYDLVSVSIVRHRFA